MMWMKWTIWALILGVIISIIIAIVGWVTNGAAQGGMFGSAVISTITLHAIITTLQVWKWTMMKKNHRD